MTTDNLLIYTTALFIVSVCLSLMVYAMRHRTVPGAPALGVVMIAVMAYAVPYLFQLGSDNLSLALFWYNLSLPGANLIGPSWLLFSISWTGLEERLPKRNIIPLVCLLLAVPVLVCLAAWSNPPHQLYGTNIRFHSPSPSAVLVWDFGLLYWVGFSYAYGLFIVGSLLLVRTALQRLRLFFHQSILLMAGALIPVIFNIAFIMDRSIDTKIDLAPFTFMVTGLVWGLAIFQFRFLTIVPIAHKSVFQHSPIGMIILDDQGLVVDINPAASAMLALGLTTGQKLPVSISMYLNGGASLMAGDKIEIIRLEQATGLRFLEMRVNALHDQSRKIDMGLLILLSDITQRIGWEQTLQESESRSIMAQKMARIGSWELDLSTRCLWGSEEALRAYGIEQASPYMPIDLIQSAAVAEDRPRLDASLKNLLEGKGAYDEEFRIRRANDQALRIVRCKANLLTHPDGSPDKVVGVIQDITDRKLIEDALRESEAKYRLIAENSGDVIWMLDMESMRHTYISPSVYQLCGYTAEEILGMPFNETMTPESQVYLQQNVPDALDQYLLGEEKIHVDTISQRHKNGSVVWVEIATRFFKEETSGKVLVLGVSRNITERKQAEAALQEKTAELENFFNLTPDLMTIATTDGAFLRTSPSWEILLGYTTQELQQGRFLDLVHPDDLQPTLDKLADLAEQKSVVNFVNRYRCKNGEYRWIEWHSQPAGGLIYATARDITERKTMEDLLFFQSTHDALTGLYNRQYYEAEMERLQQSRRFPISILVMDMNGLKDVNDSLGHHAGDALLRCAAQTIKSAFRLEDMVARIGGDEFVVLLPETDARVAQKAVERVRSILEARQPDCPDGLSVSLAIGFACGGQDSPVSQIFKQADQAMYREKKKMRGSNGNPPTY